MRATILEGRWRDPVLGRQLFSDYAEAWIVERPGLRPRTFDLYTWLYHRHLKPQLARTTLEELTPLVLRRWRATLLEAGISPTMVAKSYRLLRAILNTAVDDDILDRNPCRIHGGGDERPAERPTLTVEQVFALCDAVPPRFAAFIAVKTFASLRWGEITALRRRDINDDATLTIQAAWVERSNGALELGPPSRRPAGDESGYPLP